MISTRLFEFLEKDGTPYTVHVHPSAYTASEVAQAAHVPGRQMLKSVILKADDELVMAVLSANETANLDVLRNVIGCGVLRLASEEKFRDAFPTCKVGAMPPFGNVFGLPTYCESTLSANREIEFNAGTHEETVRMAFDDYLRLANPRFAHFAQPYTEGVQRIAA
jgi:Ala-tRNA(Pro) deacylase